MSIEFENSNDLIRFDLPNDSSIIKVIGVGGGGSNAVNHMYRQGIKGVDFMICNTDNQSLAMSPVPIKLQLGINLTEGRGAGAIPEVGKKSALESEEELKSILSKNTKMVFITAGMGGGTGTGAAPIIASLAKEMGILTVGIVTIPFNFEGKKRREQAEDGIAEMKKYVDTLLIISNDKLREMYGNLSLTNAFGKADDILTTAAKGIAEIITVPGYINVDFEDVKTVMSNGGAAILGSSMAEGENRALKAIENALNSPLLNDSDIRGAKHVLLYISYGTQELLMDEVGEITDYVQNAAGSTANMIWGTGHDETLGNKISVTLIATGFKSLNDDNFTLNYERKEKVVLEVQDKKNDEIIEAINKAKFEPEHEVEQTTDVPFEFEVKDADEIVFKVEEKPIQVTESPAIERFNLMDEEKPVTPAPVAELDHDDNPERFDLFHQETTNDVLNKEDKNILFKPNERLNRLKEISIKLKTPSGLKDLESEPAYKRRNIKLDEQEGAHEMNASKLSVGADREEGFRLRENNSFLHDSVD